MLPLRLKRLADAARGGRVADDGSVDWGHVPAFSDPVSWSRVPDARPLASRVSLLHNGPTVDSLALAWPDTQCYTS
jgi:hypothetical protein